MSKCFCRNNRWILVHLSGSEWRNERRTLYGYRPIYLEDEKPIESGFVVLANFLWCHTFRQSVQHYS